MDGTLSEIVDTLLESIQSACTEYFRWTRGRIMYDDGVEALMQVYAAQHLYKDIGLRLSATIRMERRIVEIIPNASGRVDLSIQIPGLSTVIIEFKRYLNPTVIRGDLARLATIASLPGYKAILAAPCFVREGDPDWTPIFAWNLQAEQPNHEVHMSDLRSLPTEYRHRDRWDRSKAVVVVVPAPHPTPV